MTERFSPGALDRWTAARVVRPLILSAPCRPRVRSTRMSDETARSKPISAWLLLIGAGCLALTITIGGASWLVVRYAPYLRQRTRGASPPLSDPAARERLERIEHEIKFGGVPEWSGSYSFGRHDSRRIDIAPRNGIVIRHLGYDSDDEVMCWHGDVAIDDDGLLSTTIAASSAMQQSVESKEAMEDWRSITIVPWDDLVFLVPTNRMVDFCNSVNDGWAWKHRTDDAQFPCRRTSRGSNADPKHTPLPRVPESHRAHFLEHEVNARVIEARRIEPTRGGDIAMSRQTSAVIDAGADQGLRSGMIVYWAWPQGCCRGTITSVEPARAHVMFEHGVLSPTDIEPLAAGTVVSSKRPE
jgi:hypothetical protein